MGISPHNQTTLTLRIVSDIRQHGTFTSIAFRDINILLANRTLNYQTNVSAVSSPYIDLSPYGTGCKVDEFMSYPPRACIKCHQNCKGCFGPSEGECYTCADGATFNGTHCVACYSPWCLRCSATDDDQCRVCQVSVWLYWNNTCQFECDSHLLQVGSGLLKTCKTPCNGSDFMLWIIHVLVPVSFL